MILDPTADTETTNNELALLSRLAAAYHGTAALLAAVPDQAGDIIMPYDGPAAADALAAGLSRPRRPGGPATTLEKVSALLQPQARHTDLGGREDQAAGAAVVVVLLNLQAQLADSELQTLATAAATAEALGAQLLFAAPGRIPSLEQWPQLSVTALSLSDPAALAKQVNSCSLNSNGLIWLVAVLLVPVLYTRLFCLGLIMHCHGLIIPFSFLCSPLLYPPPRIDLDSS